MSWITSLRIILGLPFILYLPGLVLTFVLWEKNEIDFIQRSAFALLFSLVLVPLVAFYLNYLTDTEITPLVSGSIIATMTVCFILLGFLKNRKT